MAQELEELLIKVRMELDNKDVDDAKKRLENLQSKGQGVQRRLNGAVHGGGDSSSGLTPVQLMERVTKQLQPSLKSESYLKALVNLTTQLLSTSKKKKGDLNSKSTESTVNQDENILTKGASATSVIPIIGAVTAGIAAAVIAVMESLQTKMSDKLNREIGLSKLSFQTGKTTDSLYRLSNQFELAGGSLKEVIGAGKALQQELLFGMSDQKAMMAMALGVNPIQLMKQSKNDPMKAIEMLNSKISQKTQGMPASMVSTIKEGMGIPLDSQFAFSNKNKANVVSGAAAISSDRGSLNNDSIQSQFVEFNTAVKRMTASMDKMLSTQAVTQSVLGYVNMKANAVTLVASSVSGLSDFIMKGANNSSTNPSNQARSEVTRRSDDSTLTKVSDYMGSKISSFAESLNGSRNNATQTKSGGN